MIFYSNVSSILQFIENLSSKIIEWRILYLLKYAQKTNRCLKYKLKERPIMKLRNNISSDNLMKSVLFLSYSQKISGIGLATQQCNQLIRHKTYLKKNSKEIGALFGNMKQFAIRAGAVVLVALFTHSS